MSIQPRKSLRKDIEAFVADFKGKKAGQKKLFMIRYRCHNEYEEYTKHYIEALEKEGWKVEMCAGCYLATKLES